MLIFVLAILLTINATTPNATIPNEADGSTDNNRYIDTVPSKESVDKLKDMCKGSEGEWKNGECTFKDREGDTQWTNAEKDKVDFEHYLADENMWNTYEEQQEEAEKENEKKEVQQVIDDINQDTKEEDDDDSGGKDEDNDGREDSNGEEWENNDYKDEEGDDD